MNIKSRHKIICLMGPTAAGKTAIAIDWVERYSFNIISVDSALVYRDMNIGTAKPDVATLCKAPHRLIDILEPTQRYSAADFCQDAIREIKSICAQGRIPLLVGGTMLYYRALQQGLAELPSADVEIRQQLDADTEKFGYVEMHQRLIAVDPHAAARIEPTDMQRIHRALEVYMLTGKPITELQQQTNPLVDYEFINLGIIPSDRAELYQRIAARFHLMIENGFIEEVEGLKNNYSLSLNFPSMRAVGYRQIWDYLDGLYSKDIMIEKGIAATRQLAKRQLTWLRSWPGIENCPIDPMSLF